MKKIVGAALIVAGFVCGCIGSYEWGLSKGENNKECETDSVVEVD